MNNQSSNDLSIIKYIVLIIKEADQYIEEWIHHYIDQIEKDDQIRSERTG